MAKPFFFFFLSWFDLTKSTYLLHTFTRIRLATEIQPATARENNEPMKKKKSTSEIKHKYPIIQPINSPSIVINPTSEIFFFFFRA